ncbi:MAG: type IV toxin-antitoxin system AbiEi family antitoxin domain-containing protein [Proteobacteria bacterium]|nr:type IV toxin-antitoxin system AbiEi family antitoxin domain-containing protein [Pseudomonadota bacterium]
MVEALAGEKPLPVGRLTRVERLSLEHLRACAAVQQAASCTAMAELIAQARASGFEIWRVEATYAAPSELRLLGLLAMSQRATLDMELIEPTLSSALSRASLKLLREGIRLGFGTVTRVQPDAPKACTRESFEGRKSLRMKALRQAREQGIMSPRDFMKLGVSRQYLSQLCARGDFVRVRPALYCANTGSR